MYCARPSREAVWVNHPHPPSVGGGGGGSSYFSSPLSPVLYSRHPPVPQPNVCYVHSETHARGPQQSMPVFHLSESPFNNEFGENRNNELRNQCRSGIPENSQGGRWQGHRLSLDEWSTIDHSYLTISAMTSVESFRVNTQERLPSPRLATKYRLHSNDTSPARNLSANLPSNVCHGAGRQLTRSPTPARVDRATGLQEFPSVFRQCSDSPRRESPSVVVHVLPRTDGHISNDSRRSSVNAQSYEQISPRTIDRNPWGVKKTTDWKCESDDIKYGGQEKACVEEEEVPVNIVVSPRESVLPSCLKKEDSKDSLGSTKIDTPRRSLLPLSGGLNTDQVCNALDTEEGKKYCVKFRKSVSASEYDPSSAVDSPRQKPRVCSLSQPATRKSSRNLAVRLAWHSVAHAAVRQLLKTALKPHSRLGKVRTPLEGH